MTSVTGPVALDGLPPVLGQYDSDERRDGWLCPWLDPLGVVTVLDAINADSANGRVYAYDFNQEVLFLDDRQEPEALTEWVEPDEDGLYQLGSRAWVWSAVEEEAPRRHLRAVPDLPEIVCIYADTDNGPCGGQTTQTGDGHDYCMNHAALRLGQ